MQNDRYGSVIIFLHWVMGVAIIAMLTSGILMTAFIEDSSTRSMFYYVHKSVGVILLWSIILRVFVRVFTKIPNVLLEMPKIERLLSKVGHFILYVLMILMPFSGWLLVSSSVYGYPTMIFNWFRWPHIQELIAIDIAKNEAINNFAANIHSYGAWILIAVITLHISAVIYHKFKQNINLLKRMWFF